MMMAVQAQGDLYRLGSNLGKKRIDQGLGRGGLSRLPAPTGLGRPSWAVSSATPVTNIHFLAVCRGSKTCLGDLVPAQHMQSPTGILTAARTTMRVRTSQCPPRSRT